MTPRGVHPSHRYCFCCGNHPLLFFTGENKKGAGRETIVCRQRHGRLTGHLNSLLHLFGHTTFIGFVESGIPLGVTFSFLVAAPMINEVALVLLFGLFGWKTALLYASTGLLIAIVSGWVIGKLKVERFVKEWVYEIKAGDFQMEEKKITFNDRIQAGHTAVVDIVSKVWIYIVAGIAVGAAVQRLCAGKFYGLNYG